MKTATWKKEYDKHSAPSDINYYETVVKMIFETDIGWIERKIQTKVITTTNQKEKETLRASEKSK